jgi:hypothetical protein
MPDSYEEWAEQLEEAVFALSGKLMELAVTLDPEYAKEKTDELANEALWGIILQMALGGPLDAIPIELRGEFAEPIEAWNIWATALPREVR